MPDHHTVKRLAHRPRSVGRQLRQNSRNDETSRSGVRQLLQAVDLQLAIDVPDEFRDLKDAVEIGIVLDDLDGWPTLSASFAEGWGDELDLMRIYLHERITGSPQYCLKTTPACAPRVPAIAITFGPFSETFAVGRQHLHTNQFDAPRSSFSPGGA
jgi:hypothetical protein